MANLQAVHTSSYRNVYKEFAELQGHDLCTSTQVVLGLDQLLQVQLEFQMNQEGKSQPVADGRAGIQ